MEAADARHDARAAVIRWRELTRGIADAPPGRHVIVAASFTAQPIAPGLGVGLRDAAPGGRVPRIEFADYNQLFQVCLDPVASGAAEADELVVLWRIEDVFERDFHAWANGEAGALERLCDGARALGAAVAVAAQACSAVASDAPLPVGYGLDHRDPALLSELRDLQRAVDAAFDDGLGDVAIDRLRLAALQIADGTIATFDRRNWLMYRQPFADWFAHRVGRSIADVIAARTRVPPKVLVLDADNTIWGGTLVDDGVGGLECSDAFPGFAYRSFQLAAQRLRHRGVLLALASKNDPEQVEEAFATLDGMVLTEADFAGRRVSWDPKPPGIADLAEEFRLGLDSFVFVDDSDYEIGAVNTLLPDVRTLRVPDEIEDLPDLLADSGWFRLMRVTEDDRERTDRMIAEAGRVRASTTMSHAEFLAQLGLRVRQIEVGPSEIGRVTQLVNKTNQFNLTTLRRSEAEIAALAGAADSRVFAYAVDDRFGEYGIVGVIIARRLVDEPAWDLDTVLMSCRVLGRGVETAMLATATATLRCDHPGAIGGTYRATDRNAMVAGLLADHGFEPTSEPERFVLPAGRELAVPDHIDAAT